MMMRRGFRNFVALALAAAILAAGSADAASAADVPAQPDLPADITIQEFQGLACLAGGTLAALVSLTYVELVATAAATAATAPVFVVVPLLATAFVAGCGAGSIVSPGLLWIYGRIE